MFIASATDLCPGRIVSRILRRILGGCQVASFGADLLRVALAGTAAGERPLRRVAELPARGGRPRDWPGWAEPDVVGAFAERGIEAPWSHQAAAAELAHAGRHV